MKFAYADPPYPGTVAKHYPDGTEVNHRVLIGSLCQEFPDGWALSTSSTTLKEVLALCPDHVRVMAWVKPWCSFKPNVRVAYAWEPVIVSGGRPRGKDKRTVRDWVSANATRRQLVHGAKPTAFSMWLFDVLGAQPDDEFVDIFPGSNNVSLTWKAFSGHGWQDVFAVLSEER